MLVNGYQKGFRSAASFGFGGQESTSKPLQAICKPLYFIDIMKYFVPILLYVFFNGCKRSESDSNPIEETIRRDDTEILEGVGEEIDMETLIKLTTSQMGVLTEPKTLVFEQADSIPVKFNCTFRDSALCCGSGRIYFVIDDTFDFDRVMENDPTFMYESCMDGKTVNLSGLDKGTHQINGIFGWQKDSWWFSKNISKNLIIN